ncbi:TIGR00282 family metallophosphoesterase [Shimazuella sp. AN120528]|uniref:TIGR00282 family metallophosphoesterase n=1 Tax=Shimazuella soli TaxID=1892854 RepID=UPI001F0D31F3|nr:TIGR00282 family metallophosphoesterase [Shimazuella soli]MCH5586417.1 TIGR00282 family metallophosphoesterase [Shimazuella soli]
MRLLMIGDIVGKVGQDTLRTYLPELRQTYQPDVVVVNGENAAINGRGITRDIYRGFLSLGIDCVTMGNHTWGQSEIFDFIEDEERIIRPANYPEGTPGRGYTIISTTKGKVVIINLMGRTYAASSLDCPFRTADNILNRISGNPYILVDMHAETTSEKQALTWYLDGRVSAVVGTHTHVQTADERILPKGTGYLTDIGMTGPYNGVIGMEVDAVVRRFVTQLPVRFEVSKEGFMLQGVLIDFDTSNKRTKKMKRIRIDNDRPWLN